MTKFHYDMQGTCASELDAAIEGGVVKDVSFKGGCQGNLRAVAALVKGMSVNDAISRLSGIQCGNKGTSCADQLARALSAKNSEIGVSVNG